MINQRAICACFVLGSTVGNLVDVTTQDSLDISRNTWIGRRGLGGASRCMGGWFPGLFSSVSRECGGAAEGEASPGSEGGGRSDTSVELL